jgi:hypothetical protein
MRRVRGNVERLIRQLHLTGGLCEAPEPHLKRVRYDYAVEGLAVFQPRSEIDKVAISLSRLLEDAFAQQLHRFS